jgi:hypothetical protein
MVRANAGVTDAAILGTETITTYIARDLTLREQIERKLPKALPAHARVGLAPPTSSGDSTLGLHPARI